MHKVEYAILSIFKQHPGGEFSTSDLVKEVFQDKYMKIQEHLVSDFPDKDKVKESRRMNAALHRKILYHLNKLVNDNILKISKIKGKGEKYYILAMSEGDYIIQKKYRKIIISKPTLPSLPIELYENKKILQKYDPSTWINRLNSVLLESNQIKGLNNLLDVVTNVFSNVNDVIGLHDFESLISTNSPDEMYQFLHKLNIDALDYNKYISITIDLTKDSDEEKITEFINSFARLHPKHINLIFNINSKGIRKNRNILTHVVQQFSKGKIKINIKNSDMHHAPYIVGRAGAHTFNDYDWTTYLEEKNENLLGLSCSQLSVVIDINRFFNNFTTGSEFRQLISKTLRTLLIANSIQRRNSYDYFRYINKLNQTNSSDFYRFSRNYIRLWNYDWQEKEQANIVDLLASCKKEMQEFSENEETIYKSCGIPLRFKAVFSSVSRKFDPQFLSDRTYLKTTVRKIKDLYSDEIKKFISTRERIFKILEGGDRLRFFRSGKIDSADILREFNFLLNTYEIPFFCYDFEERKGNLKLTQFY